MRYTILAGLAIAFLSPALHAQQWVEKLNDPKASFYEIQQAFNTYWDGRPVVRSNGYKPFRRWEWFMEPRVYPSGTRPSMGTFTEAWKQVRRMGSMGGAKSANWQPIGPTFWTSTSYNPGNGRINCMAVDPNNASTIYVGSPAGGLWRSTDNGATWTALFSNLPTLGVSGIAIDPGNSNTIYIATGDGDGTDTYSMGVLKSTDGGAIWATTGLDWQLGQSRTTRRLIMHPTDPQTLLCATSNGLWKTTDGANTWTLSIDGAFRDVEFNPGDPSIVYASTDQFFRSTDGGDSFVPVTSVLPDAATANRMSIAVSAADPQVVFVLCGNESDNSFLGIYRSTNMGLDFTLRADSPNMFNYDENGVGGGGQSWYDMALAVDPDDAQVVYLGGINVWKSVNGGNAWTIQSHWTYPSAVGYTHADIHVLEVFGSAVYCGSDGGIFRSTNGGTDWTDLSVGLNITQFYRLGGSEVEPGLVMAGAQDNGTNRLLGGLWTHVIGADGMEAAVDPDDPSIVYGASQNGGLNRSDDGGDNFNGITSGITEDGGWVTPYVIDPNQPNVLIAGYKNLWRSDDRGDSWTQLSNSTTQRSVRAIAIAPSNSDVIYYCNDAWMRRTTDGGATFVAADLGLPDLAVSSIAVDPTDASTLYVALSGYSEGDKVFKSTDAGDTWTNMSTNLPNVPCNTIVYQTGSDDGLYVGTDLGVFYTDNTLSNWQPFSDGMPNVVIDELEINYAAQKLRAATFGRGLWQSDLYEPSGLAPVASFTYSDTHLCVGEAITFADNSIEASPSWNWSFPGGTPSSSTDASPVVTYPASGSYTASLTVSNANGSDTYASVVQVEVFPNQIAIAIELDDYPNETSWNLTDDQGNVVAQGGPYSGFAAGSSVAETFCVDSGCYTFSIQDSYGDGICCGSSGNGSYTVINDENGTIASGGDYGFGESTDFCVSLSVGIVEHHIASILLVHPVDGEGLFALELPDITADRFELDVLDAMGRTVIARSLLQRQLAREPLDLLSLATGSYIVRVRADATTYTARLVR